MNKHLSDAELVAIALLPDEEPDARMHLASCASCASRMDRATAEIERQRLDHESSVESRDATFWKRQELAVMREIARAGRPVVARRGFIAAAIVTVALGGFWFGRTSVETPSPARIVAHATPAAPAPQMDLEPNGTASTDPWESESLSEFQAVVDWESWVEDEKKGEGTI